MAPRKALQTISANTPVTPRRQVTALTKQIEQRDAENENLKTELAKLTDALSKTKIDTSASAVVVPEIKINPFGPSGAVVPPQAPKRPLNSFMQFCRAKRQDFKDQNPDLTPSQVKELLVAAWEKSSESDRDIYEKMSDADTTRYNREVAQYKTKMAEIERERAALDQYYSDKKQETAMAFYNAHLAEEAAKKTKAGPATASTLTAPKQAKNVYMCFVAMRREQLKKTGETTDMSFADVNKRLAEEWKTIQESGSRKDKTLLNKCKKMADADRERYATEKEEYDAKKAREQELKKEEEARIFEETKKEALKLYGKKTAEADGIKEFRKQQAEAEKLAKLERKQIRENKKAEKDAKALLPKKPLSSYMFFCKATRPAVVNELPEGVSPKEILVELGRRWREVSESEKVPFEQEAVADRARFETEMAALKQTVA